MMTLTRVPPLAGQDRYLELDGLLLHLWTTGDPANRPVMVLHGIMGHAREWDTVSAALARHFQVHSLDQRGHGLSGWSDEYTAASLATDLIGVVETLAIDRPDVVAHSMGGMAALIAASRRPDLFGRLVILDIGPTSVTGPVGAELPGWIDLLGSSRYQRVDEAVEQWMGDPLAREDLMRHYVEHNLVADSAGLLRWRFDAAGVRDFVQVGVTPEELWRAVDGVRSPTLLVRGEHSPALSRDEAKAMLLRLRDGSYHEVQAGGHDLGVQQPERVAEAALSFLLR